jgi:hypothetical protein
MNPQQAGGLADWRVRSDTITLLARAQRSTKVREMSNWFVDKLGPDPRRAAGAPQANAPAQTPRQQAAQMPRQQAAAPAPEPEKKKKKGWF